MNTYTLDLSHGIVLTVEAESKEKAWDEFMRQRVLTRDAVNRCIDHLDEAIEIAREE